MAELKHNTFGAVGTAPQQQEPEQATMDDLQQLLELGCIKDDLTIGNMVFRLRTLNTEERFVASNYLGGEPNERKLFEFSLLVLSMAVESVNGKPLEQLVEGPVTNVMDARREILSKLQSPILTKLSNFYQEITDRADAQFTEEQVKN